MSLNQKRKHAAIALHRTILCNIYILCIYIASYDVVTYVIWSWVISYIYDNIYIYIYIYIDCYQILMLNKCD